MSEEKYQTVIIEFSNGTTGYYTGPAVVDGSDPSVTFNPETIRFTEPKELPVGASFGPIGGECGAV